MNPENMTIEELDVAINELSRSRREISARARDLAEVRKRKIADRELKAKLNRMTPAERQRIVVKPAPVTVGSTAHN